MRISATIGKLEFDAKGARDDYLAALYHVMLQAAEQFIEIAAPRVPIDTGMARGSFLNLLQLLNVNGLGHNVYIPKEPQRVGNDGKPLRYYPVRVGRHAGKKVAIHSSKSLQKTPATAMKLSTALNGILVLKGEQWVFTYETRVNHFNLNEYARNWHAFVLGRQAAAAYLTSAKVKEFLPNLSSYVSVSVISSGRNNPHSDFKVRIQKKVK